MKYKFDISSKSNRLAFSLGVSLIVGVFYGKITETKICTFSDGGQYSFKSVEVKCGKSIDPTLEIITYHYNVTSAIVSSMLTFGVLLVANAFVKKGE